ncbi:MAG: hypothetical protein PVF65_07760 [Sphingomonadales bacterium]|jgi:hypothetical protein
MQHVQSALRSAIQSFVAKDPQIAEILCSSLEGVKIEDNQSWPWHSATFEGLRHRFSLRSRFQKGQEDRADELCERLIHRLHNADLDVEGHALVDLSFAHSATAISNCDVSCEIEFDALTISD